MGSLTDALLSNVGTLSGDGGDILGSVPLKDRLLSAGIGTLGDVASAYLQNRGTSQGTEQRNLIDLMAEQRLTKAADIQNAIDLFDIQRNQDYYKGLTQQQLQFQRAAHDKYASKSGYDLASTKDLFPARELPDILKDPNAPLFDKEGHRYHRPQLGESTANRLDPALWPNQGQREDRGWGKGLTDLLKYGGMGLGAASILSGFGVPGLAWAPKALKTIGTIGGVLGSRETEASAPEAIQPVSTEAASVADPLAARKMIAEWQNLYGAENAAMLFQAYQGHPLSRMDDPKTDHYPGLNAFHESLLADLAQEEPSLQASALTTYDRPDVTKGPSPWKQTFEQIINPIWQLAQNRSIQLPETGPVPPQTFSPFEGPPSPAGRGSYVSSTAAQNPMRSDSHDMLYRFWPRSTPYARRPWNIQW